MEILVFHHPAVQIRNVELSVPRQRALVWKITSVVHQTADLNVRSTRNVLEIWLVKEKDVQIRVQGHVVLSRRAQLSNTHQSVSVFLLTLAILSLDAFLFHLVRISRLVIVPLATVTLL